MPKSKNTHTELFIGLIIGLVVGFAGADLILTHYQVSYQSGNTNIPTCSPNYVSAGVIVVANPVAQCKLACSNGYNVTSFKVDYPSAAGSYPTCYCDLNNCNPQ